ncbi:metallophosphoesterase family protein [candidate division KSB1 bacterium]
MKLAIISDIHEDIVSLQNAFRKIDKLKCDEIVCLGDIVGFSTLYYIFNTSRNARACLDLIRHNCHIIISGNHDLHAVMKTPVNSPLFEYPTDWYQMEYIHRREVSKGLVWLYEDEEAYTGLTEEDKHFIAELPEFFILNSTLGNILFTHYIYPNLIGSMKTFHFDCDDFSDHMDYMRTSNCEISMAGHAHTEGFDIITNDSQNCYPYKKRIIIEKRCCIIVPAIVKTNKWNGFLIFDTETSEAEAIRL